MSKGSQTITITSTAPPARPSGATYTPPPPPPRAWPSPSPSTPRRPSICTITAGVVTFTGAGTCTIDANQAGNGTYAAAPQVQQTVEVARVPRPSPTRRRLRPRAVGGPTYTPTATGGTSGKPVTLTIDSTSSPVLHHLRGRGDLHRGRHLHHRRQPGRQRHLQRRHPGAADASTVSRCFAGHHLHHLGAPGSAPSAERRTRPGARHRPRAYPVTLSVDTSVVRRCAPSSAASGELHRRPAPAPSTPTRPETATRRRSPGQQTARSQVHPDH